MLRDRFLPDPPGRISTALSVVSAFFAFVSVLAAGVQWAWFCYGAGSAVLAVGPVSTSRVGAWARESRAGSVFLLGLGGIMLLVPLILFDASIPAIRNAAIGGLLGGAVLTVVAVAVDA